MYKFPVWTWYVFPHPLPCPPPPSLTPPSPRAPREKGDASKTRDFLPADKQYLVTRGVPCLRRATSLAYTDADEDAERLLSFADGAGPAQDGDEWVETHAGRTAAAQGLGGAGGDIAEIPDIDGPGDADADDAAAGVAALRLGAEGREAAILDLDAIPDMEEDDLEEAEDEATAAPKSAAPAVSKTGPSGLVDAARWVGCPWFFLRWLKARFLQSGGTGEGQPSASAHVRCDDHIR